MMALINVYLLTGEHKRMGALDVCPFIPVQGVTMDDCIECAKLFGERAAEELGIPGQHEGCFVYLQLMPLDNLLADWHWTNNQMLILTGDTIFAGWIRWSCILAVFYQWCLVFLQCICMAVLLSRIIEKLCHRSERGSMKGWLRRSVHPCETITVNNNEGSNIILLPWSLLFTSM